MNCTNSLYFNNIKIVISRHNAFLDQCMDRLRGMGGVDAWHTRNKKDLGKYSKWHYAENRY